MGLQVFETVSLALLPLPRRAIPAEEIVFRLTPILLTHNLDLLAPLQAYLERATGFPVRLLQRRTYQEITATQLCCIVQLLLYSINYGKHRRHSRLWRARPGE
ncbi:MAG: phosphonate ABC transporter substrate-binding protein, partial [Rhodomicrobium sp.]